MEMIVQRRIVELEEIEEELKIRDGESAKLLQKALKHADAIQEMINDGTMDDEIQSKLVSVLTGNKQDEENKKLREEILEEIKARMEQRREENVMKGHEFI